MPTAPRRADFVAADLLAQAEHSADAQAMLVTTSRELAQATVRATRSCRCSDLSRAATLRESFAHARIILVESLDAAFEVSNAYAPEHLIVQVENARAVVAEDPARRLGIPRHLDA